MRKEFTWLAIILGLVIGVVMTAANVYLGLYAGMTVSASIPAAVIAMGVFRGIFRRSSVLESNIVQTIASAGESLAAGIIFTVPALVLVGAWNGFQFWPTTLIAIAGGLLGIIFMIPLRRTLIVEDKELIYPEGVACAAVLKSGDESDTRGFVTILKGLLLGGLFKFGATGLKVISGSVEVASNFFGRIFFVGSDISPALLAVGYIVRLEVAVLVFIGGAIGWFIGIPAIGISTDLLTLAPVDVAWKLWGSQIRYVGVGAMLVGGIWSIISVRSGIVRSMHEIGRSYRSKNSRDMSPTERDMSLIAMMVIFIATVCLMFGLYYFLIGKLGYTFLTTAIMVVASFLFVAVSSYIVGLVGSSNNPVSGITIAALLGTSALFLVLGLTGDSAILATLGVAAIVCCAACTAGDCSQDLKTGVLVKASPRLQQWAQVIGVLIPAFVIAPVLTLLHSAYGIGEGLKAPQATLFASITKALFKDGQLPVNMVIFGIGLGIIVLIIDYFLKARKSKFRLHLMPMAVGIYLPVTLAVPLVIGGIVRKIVEKRSNGISLKDSGTLFSSGMIAGEAVLGVILAVFIYYNISFAIEGISKSIIEIASIMALAFATIYLYRIARK